MWRQSTDFQPQKRTVHGITAGINIKKLNSIDDGVKITRADLFAAATLEAWNKLKKEAFPLLLNHGLLHESFYQIFLIKKIPAEILAEDLTSLLCIIQKLLINNKI